MGFSFTDVSIAIHLLLFSYSLLLSCNTDRETDCVQSEMVGPPINYICRYVASSMLSTERNNRTFAVVYCDVYNFTEAVCRVSAGFTLLLPVCGWPAVLYYSPGVCFIRASARGTDWLATADYKVSSFVATAHYRLTCALPPTPRPSPPSAWRIIAPYRLEASKKSPGQFRVRIS